MSHELDLEVAEKVMGQTPRRAWSECLWPPAYSTNENDAMQIVQKMAADGYQFGQACRNGSWTAVFYRDGSPGQMDNALRAMAASETSAEAICRAALKASVR